MTFSLKSKHLFAIAAIAATTLCAASAHAQQGLSRANDDTPDLSTQAVSSAINVGNTGISQAAGLARPSDTLSVLNRELGKVGTDSPNPMQEDAERSRSRTPARPAEPPTQFQRFVHDATGKLLPHFGAQLFDAPSPYNVNNSLAVPKDY